MLPLRFIPRAIASLPEGSVAGRVGTAARPARGSGGAIDASVVGVVDANAILGVMGLLVLNGGQRAVDHALKGLAGLPRAVRLPILVDDETARQRSGIAADHSALRELLGAGPLGGTTSTADGEEQREERSQGREATSAAPAVSWAPSPQDNPTLG